MKDDCGEGEASGEISDSEEEAAQGLKNLVDLKKVREERKSSSYSDGGPLGDFDLIKFLCSLSTMQRELLETQVVFSKQLSEFARLQTDMAEFHRMVVDRFFEIEKR